MPKALTEKDLATHRTYDRRKLRDRYARFGCSFVFHFTNYRENVCCIRVDHTDCSITFHEDGAEDTTISLDELSDLMKYARGLREGDGS